MHSLLHILSMFLSHWQIIVFSNRRYKQHKTDHKTLPQTRPIPVPCRASGCKCKSYHYVPKNGTQPIRCQCKHFADDHTVVAPFKCSKGCSCKAFRSSYTCGCGEPTYAHKVGAVCSYHHHRYCHHHHHHHHHFIIFVTENRYFWMSNCSIIENNF